MPSREVIEIASAADDDVVASAPVQMSSEASATKKSAVASKSKASAGSCSTTVANDLSPVAAATKRRKITPVPATNKKDAAKKKPKNQPSIASFFGKSKVPATPHASASTKNTKKLTKAASISTTKPVTTKTSAKGASSLAKRVSTTPVTQHAAHQTKMDFKDVIVGNLSKTPSSAFINQEPIILTSEPLPVATGDSKLDKMLPRLALVSSFPKKKRPTTSPSSSSTAGSTTSLKASPPTESKSNSKSSSSPSQQGIQSVPSQDESEAGNSIGMGAVKSQLVHKFENPPAAADDEVVQKFTETKSSEFGETAKQVKEAAGESTEDASTSPSEAVVTAEVKVAEPDLAVMDSSPTKSVVDDEPATVDPPVEPTVVNETMGQEEGDNNKSLEETSFVAEKTDEEDASLEKSDTAETKGQEIKDNKSSEEKAAVAASAGEDMVHEKLDTGETKGKEETHVESMESKTAAVENAGEDVSSKISDANETKGQENVSVESAESKAAILTPVDTEKASKSEADEEKVSGDVTEEEVPVNPITVGSLFQKKFSKHGFFQGKVTEVPTGNSQYYKVIYPKDGDIEDLLEKSLLRLMNTKASKKIRKENGGSDAAVTPAIRKSPPTNATTSATTIAFFGVSSKPKAAVTKAVTKKAVVTTTVTVKAASPILQETPKYQLDPVDQALLDKHQLMQTSHVEKAKQMVEQGRNTLDTSEAVLAIPSTENISISEAVSEFPDTVVPLLLALLEGSKLPLSVLAKSTCDALNAVFPAAAFPLDMVSSKIKVLSARKAYIKNPLIAIGTSVSNNLGKDINPFEDVNPDQIWRWEVVTLDLLPDETIKSAKIARSARRKLQLQFNATARLLAALEESIKLFQTSKAKPKADKVVSKISREEEKVLKFEQDIEKIRLAAEAKKLKQAKKEHTSKEDEEKKKAAALEKKEAADLEKKVAADQRKKEKDDAKQKKELEREEAKKQKEEKVRAEEAKKTLVDEKQKKRMLSFFVGPSKKSKKNDVSKAVAQPKEKASKDVLKGKPASPKKQVDDNFDGTLFRSSINTQGERKQPKKSVFSSLSERASTSRKPKTKRVNMRVFISGANAGDPFAAQPAFAEERIIQVRNRNKFLKFTEDCRPAYHGTWSKHSSNGKRLGRNPFLRDGSLDYDVDSEGEWEEGDDDPGEDVENDAGDGEDDKSQDDEGDTRVYNYQDGWLAQDDEIGDDAEMDDETKQLFISTRKQKDVSLVPVCIVSPADGGIPIMDDEGSADLELYASKIEGFPAQEAVSLIRAHIGLVLAETDIYLDAFPPVLVDEQEGAKESTPAQTIEPSDDAMKIIARFVHHSTLVSKSMVVEELRATHPTVTASRTQAHRVLDAIAEKKRHPKNGVYWEVKQSVVDKLGLTDELKPMQLPEPEVPKKKEGIKKKDSKKRKSPDASDKKTETKAKKVKAASTSSSTPATAAPKEKGSAKKKKAVAVSAASANLLKSFLIKKK